MSVPHLALLLAMLPAAQPAPPDVTGVYVVDAPQGTWVFEFRDGKFSQHLPGGRAWVGTVTQGARELTLTMEHHEVKTTYAVEDGVLWLAVLPHDSRGAITGDAVAQRHDAMSPGNFLRGPQRVRPGAAAGDWWGRNPDDKAWRAPTEDERAAAAPSPSPRPAWATPWSVRLGRTGLRPHRSGVPLWGVFAAEGTTVKFIRDAASVPSLANRLMVTVPEPGVLVTPAAPGVWSVTWGPNCGMGHFDAPAVTTYVMLDDQRVLRHVRTSAHWSPGPPLPDLVLTRVAVPAP